MGLKSWVNKLKEKSETKELSGMFEEVSASTNKIDRITTGSIILDHLLGGGWAVGRLNELCGVEASGKAQPLSSNVLTPNGFVKMGSLEVGSIVCAPDGTNTTVIGIFPQGRQPVYRITFDDRTSTLCTADHLWAVYTRDTKHNLADVLTTKELLEIGVKSANNTRKFKIPNNSPLLFNGNVTLPIDPYLLGLLLGDGSFKGSTIKFSTPDKELLDSISNILNADFPEMTLSDKKGKYDYNLKNIKRSHVKTRLWEELGKLGLVDKYSEEKYIPKQYLFAGKEQRLNLLRGLIDTDGSVSAGSFSYSTSSEKLAEDFVFLARSLGFRAVKANRQTKFTAANGERVDGLPSYRINLLMTSPDTFPVRLSKKADKYVPQNIDYSSRFIESIELAGEEECQCIKVGHPDSLYITDDFIVTHNTTCCLETAREIQKSGKAVVYIDSEFSLNIKYATKIGVDMDPDKFMYVATNGFSNLRNIIGLALRDAKESNVGLIIVDSATSVASDAATSGELDPNTPIGEHARFWSGFCPTVAGLAKQNNVTFLFTNQMRAKIDVRGGKVPQEDQVDVTGGRALKYYKSVSLYLSQSSKDEEKKHVDELTGETGVGFRHFNGANITARVLKNKVAHPFAQGRAFIRFGVGFDNLVSCIGIFINKGLVRKTGGWYYFLDESGKEIKVQGEESLYDELKARRKLIQGWLEKLGFAKHYL